MTSEILRSTPRTSSLFWTLVKLRYKLIWAQARSSSGRVFLLIVVTLFFSTVGAFLAMAGLGAAVAGVHLGRAEVITRGILSGFHLSAVITSLFFGLGPRAAFSEPVLRRFPLTSRQRVFIRHLIGLIDPIWFVLATCAIGIAVGLAITGSGSILGGLLAAALYVSAAYLSAALTMALVDWLMQTPAGSTALALVGLTALSFSGLGISWLFSVENPERLESLDRLLHFAPSGLTTQVMMAPSLWARLVALTLLLAWAVALLLGIGWLERRRARQTGSSSSATGEYQFDTLYDRVARLFGPVYGPLVGKSLRYYLRSNRVRLGLASAPIFAFMGGFMSQNPALRSSDFYFTFSFFAFLGFSGTSSIALNQFGSDGKGARRYALLPTRFGVSVRAGSLTSLILGLAVITPTIWLWTVVTKVEFDWRAIVMLAGSSLGGIFLFNGLAMWTTLFSPKAVDFTSMLNNRLSLGGNLVVAGGLIVVFVIHFVLMRRALDSVLALWWLSTLLALFSFVFYLVCWWAIGPVAGARRRAVIETITSES
jgi:hypothetical protein